jgi:hypothetical protein
MLHHLSFGIFGKIFEFIFQLFKRILSNSPRFADKAVSKWLVSIWVGL